MIKRLCRKNSLTNLSELLFCGYAQIAGNGRHAPKIFAGYLTVPEGSKRFMLHRGQVSDSLPIDKLA